MRSLNTIQKAENEFFEKVWFIRHQSIADKTEKTLSKETLDKIQTMMETYGDLGPYNDYELGMLEGKLSALRWVLGSDWNFLDT